jgi:hypothetical protein
MTPKRKSSRVQLELPLEIKVATWSPPRRIALAEKLERWARQLRVSAAILLRDEPKPTKRLKPIPQEKAALN